MSPSVGRAILAGLLITAAACSERPSPLEPRAGGNPFTAPVSAAASSEQLRNERLARRLALALGEAEFRGALLRSLQQSRISEGKVHLQRFLSENQNGQLRRLAELAREPEAAVATDLLESDPLEVYLPVPAHRRQWRGDAAVLVATALGDHDVPVAFDTDGNRQLLSPDVPPTTPVIALGRAEVRFPDAAAPAGIEVYDEDPNGGGFTGGGGTGTGGTNEAYVTSPGLYMTYAKVNSSFEGWLKGNPEFEIHILGQDGSSNAMKSYQCAGESAGTPYQYNQDEEEWRGNVMLFSQAQLDAYKAEHPGQALRVLVLEDDDTRCVIKTDSTRVAKLFQEVIDRFGQLTAGKDTLISVKTFRKAASLISIFKAFWSTLQTKDDVVGTAIEDSVAQEYYYGANWIIKGANSSTQGALKLEMH